MPMPPPKPSTEGPRDRQVSTRWASSSGRSRPTARSRPRRSPGWSERLLGAGSLRPRAGVRHRRRPRGPDRGRSAGRHVGRPSRRRRSVGSPAPAGLASPPPRRRSRRARAVRGPGAGRPGRSGASGCPPIRSTAAGRCRRPPAPRRGRGPRVDRGAWRPAPTRGCSGSSRPLPNWPPGQVTTGRWSRSQSSLRLASPTASSNADRAACGSSPSSTPYRPSATSRSGTLLAQSPVLTMPMDSA